MKFVGMITLLFWMGNTSSFAQATPNSTETVYLSQEENQFYVMINQFRERLGLPQLQIHVSLQNAAKKYSVWMASQNFLTHFGPTSKKTAFDRMKDEGYTNYRYAGENISCGRSEAIKAFRDFAFSPKHLENMINPHYRHLGVARAKTDVGPYYYYWTTDFASNTDSDSDPADITDLQQIRDAIEYVSGAVPATQKVELPEAQPTPTPEEPTEVQAPKNEVNNYSHIQCIVPYSLAKNNLSYFPNADAVLDITPNEIGSYKGVVNYFVNGQATAYYPLFINNISVVKNSNFPVFFIFSAPTSKSGGFMIQMNTQNSSAQYDVYPMSLGVSGSALCSFKN